MGIKIAALLLTLEGQRRGWIADVFATELRPVDALNEQPRVKGYGTHEAASRPPRSTAKVHQRLEKDLRI